MSCTHSQYCYDLYYVFDNIIHVPTFLKSFFFQNSFRITISVSNGLDSDHIGHFVRPDPGPNCLQRLSAYDTSRD